MKFRREMDDRRIEFDDLDQLPYKNPHEDALVWKLKIYIYRPLVVFCSYVDYFGLMGVYIRTVNKIFWLFFKLPVLTSFPGWLQWMLYSYILILPHVMVSILLVNMIHDHFVLEPARRKRDK